MGTGRLWPLPRRDAEDRSDPVELLVDITFVLALSQAVSLLRLEPGAGGVLRTIAALFIVIRAWEESVSAVTMGSVTAAPLKLLMIVQTGLFLALAICVPEAFSDITGGLDGPVVFATVFTLNCVCGAAQWFAAHAGDPRQRGNLLFVFAAYVGEAALIWWAVCVHGSAKTLLMLAAPIFFTAFMWATTLPVYDRLRFGLVEGWQIYGFRALSERYLAAYTVACCLSLELLEQVGQSQRISPAMLTVVGAALLTAYLLYRLYEPLIEPARFTLDARNLDVGLGRKLLMDGGYHFGHLLMCGGLAVGAGALRSVLVAVASVDGGVTAPIGMVPLAGLYGGIAAVLLGQAGFSFVAIWKADPLRLVTPLLLLVAIVPLSGTPVLVAPLVLVGLLVVVAGLDQHRAVHAARAVRTARVEALTAGPAGLTAAQSVRARLRPRRWRPTIQFADGDHELSGFELLFDIMVAFAFAQCDVVVLRDQSPEGALRALLVLAMLWGCWMTFVWAGNTADANVGTLRTLHVCALSGMVFLGLALPMAFVRPGFSMRAALYLGAYVLIRVCSAIALRTLLGRTAGRRPLIVAGAPVVTALLIALATQVPRADRVGLWIAALACEVLATLAFMRGWRTVAPGHLAERFAFIVIIGLDMSMGGMGQQLNGEAVALPQLLLIGMALISCTIMWWLYFDLLARYAEHRLHRTMRSVHHRIVHGHYNAAHLVLLAGMVAFGFGLRAIARDLATGSGGGLGPPLPPLLAIALGAGVAVFALGICGMWLMLGRRPRRGWAAVVVGCLVAIPVAVGAPALVALAGFVVLGLLLVVDESLSSTARAERGALRSALAEGHGESPTAAGEPVAASNAEDVSTVDLGRWFQTRFRLLDVNGDGVISWADFTDLLHRMANDPATSDEETLQRAETRFRALWNSMREAMDLDDDNIITREEYIAFMTAMAAARLPAEDGAPNPWSAQPTASRLPVSRSAAYRRGGGHPLLVGSGLTDLIESELALLADPSRSDDTDVFSAEAASVG
ncbi:hypothetical protein GCM10009839_25160 [Catenulispora yoronensis]|uniref:EF-hand domain-containing protein n=1 Tax=Catenulispora yoronensis TaxID=450799 RepID=A0ABP5FFS1_9ACTN